MEENTMEKTEELIKLLDFERLAGTRGEKKARKILIKCLEKLNVEVTTQTFEFIGFNENQGVIEISDRQFPCVPFGLTDSVNIAGELVFVENPKALKFSNKNYKEKIILSYGSLPLIQQYLLKNEAVGFISIGPPFTKAMSMTNKQHQYKTGVVPAVSIDHEIGLALLSFENTPLKIKIKQKPAPKKGVNIIADIPGTLCDNSLTYLVGHYDSVAHSNGSNDNAGGVISILKTLEYFSNNPPQRNLRAIFFSSEELGLLGSFEYVKKHGTEIEERAQLVINIDGAGDALGLNKYYVIGTQSLLGYIDGVSKEIGLVFQKSLDTFNSDCIPFAQLGIPSVSIEKCLGKGSFHYHTPDDTAIHTSVRGLAAPIKAAIGILSRILNSDVYPIERKIDHHLKSKIESDVYKYTGEKKSLS